MQKHETVFHKILCYLMFPKEEQQISNGSDVRFMKLLHDLLPVRARVCVTGVHLNR